MEGAVICSGPVCAATHWEPLQHVHCREPGSKSYSSLDLTCHVCVIWMCTCMCVRKAGAAAHVLSVTACWTAPTNRLQTTAATAACELSWLLCTY
jgi:hypothetical protein